MNRILKIFAIISVSFAVLLLNGCGDVSPKEVAQYSIDDISFEAYNLGVTKFGEKYSGKTITASGNVKTIAKFDNVKDAVVIKLDACNKINSNLSGVFHSRDVEKFNLKEGDNITVEIPYGQVIINKNPVVPYSLNTRKFYNSKEVQILSSELVDGTTSEVRGRVLGRYEKSCFDIRELSNEFVRLGKTEFKKRYLNKNIRVFGFVYIGGTVASNYTMYDIFHHALDEKKDKMVRVVVEGMASKDKGLKGFDYVVMDGNIESVDYYKEKHIDEVCISLIARDDMRGKNDERKYIVNIKNARRSYSLIGDLRKVFGLTIGDKYSADELYSLGFRNNAGFLKYVGPWQASFWPIKHYFWYHELIPLDIGYVEAGNGLFNKDYELISLELLYRSRNLIDYLKEKYGEPHRIVVNGPCWPGLLGQGGYDGLEYAEWEDDGIVLRCTKKEGDLYYDRYYLEITEADWYHRKQ